MKSLLLKKIRFFCLMMFGMLIVLSSAEAQRLRIQSKDSANGRPKWDGYILMKLKFNGIYDIRGGLQGANTFNLNKIDVWGTDNTPNLWMDMYQSQIRLYGSHEIGGSQAIGYFEADFWGGENKMRMRMAYVRYKFFQIGQDWSFFGDKDIWPNVFDWDGPSSGIWRRDPFIEFFYTTKDKWHFELGVEAPAAQINFLDDIDSAFMKSTGTPIPDFIGAAKKSFDWGHLRLAGIARFLPYRKNGDLRYVNGYGAALSGYIKTGKKHNDPIQFQFVFGKGIATYVVSFDGANYDAVTDGYGNMVSVPILGGWLSHEYWFNDIFHMNIVGGLTVFTSPDIKYLEIPDGGFYMQDGHVELNYYYGLLNFMADPIDDLTVGIELNIGSRANIYHKVTFPDTTDPGFYASYKQARIATRISFGVFYNF